MNLRPRNAPGRERRGDRKEQHHHAQPTRHRPAHCGPRAPAGAYCHQITDRLPGTGPVLAVLTGGPADLAVARTAATWAAGTGSLLIAVTVVTSTGFSINPLLHQVRARRQDADSLAVIDRLTPILTASGVAWLRTIVAVPTRAGPTLTLAPALPLATIRRLVDRYAGLQQVREYPAISLLLSTTPVAELTGADALGLDALTAEAVERLRGELQSAAAAPAIGRLHTLLGQARHGPSRHGLAVYASAGSQAPIRLPIGVRDRAVGDPTFATRDLIRAPHRTPRHLVLALNPGQPGCWRRCRHPTARRHLGLPDVSGPHPHTRPRPRRPAQPGVFRRRLFRQVDAALGADLRLHPAPLVLVGDERTTAAFKRLSANCQRLAGIVTGNLAAPGRPS